MNRSEKGCQDSAQGGYIMNWNSAILPIVADNLGDGYPWPIYDLIPGDVHIAILEMDGERFGDQFCVSTP
jgi:hypothetical protein